MLRVMNDDLVQPSRGFGTHPHRDMEIVTYVVRGQLSHADSMGTSETLGPGSVQFMTAGTGVRHSEHNLDPGNDLRFIQMWLTPRSRGLNPNYGSLSGDSPGATTEPNRWLQLVSDVNDGSSQTPVKINTDANIWVVHIEEGSTAAMDIRSGRQAYLLCIRGNATVAFAGEAAALVQHDAAELRNSGTLEVCFCHAICLLVGCPLCITSVSHQVTATAPAHLLLVEMANDGSGREDL